MELGKKLEELKPTMLNCNAFSIYDYPQSYTITELLCEFFKAINDCIDLCNKTFDLVEWLVNVGIKKEVALKLQEWLEDGTLASLINETLFKELNEKINGKVDKKYHSVCVNEYGAVGDGITDDSDAIIKCLNENKEVYFLSNNSYLITKHIKLNPNNVVMGNNCKILYGTSDACIEINKGIVLDRFNLTVNPNIELSKSVLLIDGNTQFNVGFADTPTISNITGEQIYTDGTKRSTFIHFKCEQKNAFEKCYISGINIFNIKAIRFKFGIKTTVSEIPGTSNKTYVTSNIVNNFQGFNCENFIFEYEPIGNRTSLGANTYSSCHFQPMDNGTHIFLHNTGNGNIIKDCNFWDNTRCLNTKQIIIKSNNNVITGGELPPYDSEYWDIQGKYNFIMGHTFGTPSFLIPVVVSDRNIYRLFNNSKKTVPFINNVLSNKIKSNANDVSINNVNIDISTLQEGHNVIKFNSFGTGVGSQTNFKFKIKINDNDNVIGNISNDFSNNYNVDCIIDIRKYTTNCEINTCMKLNTSSSKSYIFSGSTTVQNTINNISLDLTFMSEIENYFTNLYSESEMIAQ